MKIIWFLLSAASFIAAVFVKNPDLTLLGTTTLTIALQYELLERLKK